MKRHILSLLCAGSLLATSSFAQLPRIVVQGDGAPQVFTEFDAAVAAAQPDDKLYLGGGTFLYPPAMPIDKPLHFIGAGIHPDSTQVTGVTTLQQNGGNGNQSLRIVTTGSGSTFTGIRFVSIDGGQNSTALAYGTDDLTDDPADLVFERCWFTGRFYLGSGTANVINTTTAFDECVFLGTVDGVGRSAVFTRCIIANGQNTVALTGLAGSSAADNCLVMGAIQSLSNISVRNSYIRTNNLNNYAVYSCSNCLFQNTLVTNNVVASGSPGTVVTDCLSAVNGDAVCVAETDGFYQISDDLRMATGGPGSGFGLDGNDVGIYGTSAPYRPGAVPYNPHFRAAEIAPATNSDGQLPVNIRVAAQPD
jgi:hypothetical protein